jgi:hypothetical protein
MKIKLLIFLFLLLGIDLYSQDEAPLPKSRKAETLSEYLERIFGQPEYVKNKFKMEADYSTLWISSDVPHVSDVLKSVAGMEIHYGVTRENHNLVVDNIFYHSREEIFLSSISSSTKLFQDAESLIKTDAWRFGFTYTSGYGFTLPNQHQLTLTHKAGLCWTQIDVETFPYMYQEAAPYLISYDMNTKFGTLWSMGANYKFDEDYIASFEYEHSLVNPNFELGQFARSWILEVALQRWMDFFEEEMLRSTKEKFPYIYFIYKSTVSSLIYYYRSEQAYWPSKSSKPLNYRGIKLGITYVF